jgi:hypothetical protein
MARPEYAKRTRSAPISQLQENIVIDKLRTAGLSPTASYLAGFLSIAASIVIWNSEKSKDSAHAERFGIFVGLWAPTFFAIGNGLDAAERHSKL